MAPGALFARTWSVLEDNLAAQRDVYLDGVQLRVVENSNEFPYYRERRRDKASGYERTSRRYGVRRAPAVTVRGNISGKDRADQVYADFVRGCKENTQGLVVETVKRLRQGGTGKDASFELMFLPGSVVEVVVEEGADPLSVTLTDLSRRRRRGAHRDPRAAAPTACASRSPSIARRSGRTGTWSPS